jgi:hypothetical protein
VHQSEQMHVHAVRAHVVTCIGMLMLMTTLGDLVAFCCVRGQ